MEKTNREQDVNYVILQDNGTPLSWTDNGLPVIYGSIEDAELDLLEDENIVTLGEYAEKIGVDWKNLVTD